MKKTMMFLVLGMLVAVVAKAEEISELLKEFQKREAMSLTADQGAVIQFLKTIKYDTQGIVELEVLDPKFTFVFRDRNGDVCFGDSLRLILRCKNEMGLTGVTFQGDSD